MIRLNSMRMLLASVIVLPALLTTAVGAQIHDAAQAGDRDLVFELVAKDPTMLEIRDEIGASPLWYAASLGHVELARELVAAGAEVTVATRDGLTPLHWAAVRGFYDVCLLMLDNGADVNARSVVQANTPLHEVWNNGGQPRIAELLISRGAQLDAVEKWYGMSPLHYAANKGLTELAAVLIEAGSDLTLEDRWGRTPADHASNAATRALFAELAPAD